jgi:hypothetical protein
MSRLAFGVAAIWAVVVVLAVHFLLARRALTARSIATWVRLLILSVPIAYVVFDLLENASVLALLALGGPLAMLSVAFLRRDSATAFSKRADLRQPGKRPESCQFRSDTASRLNPSSLGEEAVEARIRLEGVETRIDTYIRNPA